MAEQSKTEVVTAIRRWREDWYVWRRTRGAWQSRSREWMKAEAGRWIDALGIPHTQTGKGNFMEAVLTNTFLDDRVEPPRWTGESGRRNDSGHVYVSFRNGVLDLDEWLATGDLRRALLKHSPDFWTLCALPYDFNPDATCPKFEEAVKLWQSTPEGQLILQAWAGYCFIPGHPQQVFLMNLGRTGGDGKSQFADVLTALVGAENVAHVGLDAFDPRKEFGLQPLLGKMLNITPDAADLEKVGEGMLKAIVGGDTVTVNRKHKDPLHVTMPCKFMINCNQLPPIRDRSEGIWRRLLLLKWEPVPEGQVVEEFAKKIIATEIQGVFNWALVGYQHVRAKGFADLRSGALLKNILEARSEVQKERLFFEECISFDPRVEVETSASRIVEAYQEWCTENNVKRSVHGDNLMRSMRRWLMEQFPDHREAIKEASRRREVVEGDSGTRKLTFWKGVVLLRSGGEGATLKGTT